MTTRLKLRDTRSKKRPTNIIQAGLKALNLALVYQTEIDARQPGIIVRIGQDLDAMGAVGPGVVQARNEAMAATSAQNVLVDEGHLRVQTIRDTVRRSGADKDIRRAYGVGQQLPQGRVRHVKAGLQQIVDRATKEPEEAAMFGLIPVDVAAMATFITSLIDADTTQEKKRASAPLSTKERNRTENRILQSVALIAGAGKIAFITDPITFASFDALVTPSRKARDKGKDKGKAKEKDAMLSKVSASSACELAGKPSGEASKEASNEASNEASKEASREASNEASKEAPKEASNEASTKASSEASRPTASPAAAPPPA